MHKHFEEKDALNHVITKRIEGAISLSESHDVQMPEHLWAAATAVKETGLVMLLLWALLRVLAISHRGMGFSFLAFGTGWLAWKVAQSAWRSWIRLERLHRVIEQEKYEIEHHRPQEREELLALYRSKGFEGKLLEEVVDVLMADQDRLLKVMLEEELGLTLQVYEHPLKQALGTFLGIAAALCVSGALFVVSPSFGMLIASFLLLGGGALLSAIYEKNRVISAIIWNGAMGGLAFGIVYFVCKLVM